MKKWNQKKSLSKKLTLNRETVRLLTVNELGAIAGGMSWGCSKDDPTTCTC